MNSVHSFFIILPFISATLFGIICYNLAKTKNRNEFAWALSGLLFAVFALLTLLYLPKQKKTRKKAVKQTAPASGAMHNESAAALNGEEAFEPPKQPRLTGNKSVNWYFIDQHSENSIKGPFTINDLRIELHTNNLDASTYIWCEEFEEWTPISEFSNASLILDTDFIE